MNGTPSSQIQIIAPFTAALDWMKMMLFRPFDFAKWLTVGFAAFLAGNFGFNIRINRSWGTSDWKYSVHRDGVTSAGGNWDFAPWLIALIAGIVLLILALSIVWAWVSARGRFMFVDCIVKNRGAIAEPWHEYRREGNSYFLFWLVIGFCSVVLLAIIGACLWLLFGESFRNDDGGDASVVIIVVIAAVVLVWVVVALVFALVSNFMVPVMYRRRCTAREAFFDVAKLIAANPGPFILFILFVIALFIGLAIISTIIACATCCFGALPYVSTVILLPAIVWLAAYKLLFIRQFGDAYDVWATVAPPPPPAVEPLPPPPAT